MLVALALFSAVVVTACGGSSGGTTPGASNTPSTPAASSTTPAPAETAPADAAGATTEIKTNWTKFFNYKTPRPQQIALLENGDQLGPAIAFAANLQKKQHLKELVKVHTVAFTSPTQANVGYALYNGTKVLLPTAGGVALLVNGKWKVSKATFCTLVTLGNGNKPVPSC
jgi:hypothetical protein